MSKTVQLFTRPITGVVTGALAAGCGLAPVKSNGERDAVVRMIRIILSGPLPPPMGGNSRHFAILTEDLAKHERFSVKVLNTSRGLEPSNRLRNLALAIKTMLAIILNVARTDIISHHASDRGMFLFGPIVVGLGKLTGKPTILRLFGGSFGDFYFQRGWLGQAIIRYLILSADVVLLQTHRAKGQLQQHASGRLEWFCTYIKTVHQLPQDNTGGQLPQDRACSRFVFLGHLWRTKGLETILEASSGLPGGCHIDIYGPQDEYSPDEIRQRGSGRVTYQGFLSHTEVDEKLWNYDCLVLPTFHPGEGYPGVIAEAFAHGLPVITTKFKAIPEIVDEECGILIEPGDTNSFVEAVTALHRDKHRWRRLKQGALRRSSMFDHQTWSKKFEQLCEDLVCPQVSDNAAS